MIEKLSRIIDSDGAVFILQCSPLFPGFVLCEPHYDLPVLTILPSKLAADVLVRLGRIPTVSAYTVKQWPSYEELMELSSTGAGILETRSVELAKKYNVKLYVGKSLESNKRKGTYVMNDSIYIEEMPVTGISISDDCSIYSLRGMENDGVAITKLFQLLADLHINVDMVSCIM